MKAKVLTGGKFWFGNFTKMLKLIREKAKSIRGSLIRILVDLYFKFYVYINQLKLPFFHVFMTKCCFWQ